MIGRWIAVAAVGLLAVQAGAQGGAPAGGQGAPAAPKTTKEKVSYSIGADVGKGLKTQGIDIDMDALVRGIKDAFAGSKLAMTDEDIKATMTAFVADLQKRQKENAEKMAAANLKEGEAFLTANKAKPGVVTLPSGLQYKIEKAGTGKKPTDADTVQVNYKGMLVNGTEFDSSAAHGKPAEFKVGGVIPGWTEALKLMPVGSKWQLVIPPKLAYGDRGTPGGPIPPNAVLVFDVELLAIK